MTAPSRSAIASTLVVLGLLSICGCALENRIVSVPKSLASRPVAGLAKLKTLGGCRNTAIDGESFVAVDVGNTGWSGILPGRRTIRTDLRASTSTPFLNALGRGTRNEEFSSVLSQSVTFEAVSGRQYILACELIESDRWQAVIYDCTEGGCGLFAFETSEMKLIAKSGTP